MYTHTCSLAKPFSSCKDARVGTVEELLERLDGILTLVRTEKRKVPIEAPMPQMAAFTKKQLGDPTVQVLGLVVLYCVKRYCMQYLAMYCCVYILG